MRGHPALSPGSEAVMSFIFPSSPATSWMEQPATYLAVAAACLMITLRFLKRALSQMGALIHAATAAAVVAFTAVFALAMVVIATFLTVR
jgi:hypothetical protein